MMIKRVEEGLGKRVGGGSRAADQSCYHRSGAENENKMANKNKNHS